MHYSRVALVKPSPGLELRLSCMDPDSATYVRAQPRTIRGKAGELGRRRIGTVDLWKYGLCLTTFFAFTFFFLASARSGNNPLSFSCSGNSVLNRHRKTAFFSAIMSRVHLSDQNSFFLEH